MKIIRARIYLVRIAGRHPVLVELETDEGVTGVGDAAIAYGSGGTAAAGMIKDLVDDVVLGKDPFRIEALWGEMLYPYRVPEHFAIVDHAPELDVKSGRLPIPSRPGLGVALVPERVRPHLWAECA